MKKYIYKITNIINDKSYIGQTTDYKRRFTEHKALGYGQEKTKYLYNAINHYGIENFLFEVIEGPIENYNEREKYWIKQYNTYFKADNAWGYNMTEGGEEPPLHIKEDSPFATHTQQEVDKVIELIQTTKISFKDIGQLTNYDSSTIERINKGLLWYDDNLEYPLRIDHSRLFTHQRALKIISDLKNTSLTQKQIAEKYNVARTTITAINNGQNNKQKDLDYPIRKIGQQVRPIEMHDLENNYIKSFNSINDAARFLGNINKRSTIGCCLRGITNTACGYIWKYKE